MNSVSLLIVTGFLAVDAKGDDVVRRLQEEQLLELRRRNALDDIGNMFIDMGDIVVDVGDVFVDGWEEVEDFFTEDMVHWFEEDFVDFWVDFANLWADTAQDPVGVIEDFGDWTADVFTEGWDAVVTGMEEAWNWTEDAAVAAWEFSEDLFNKFGCLVEDWTGKSCIKCVKETCNATLDQETIDKIDQANSIALQDMDDEFDPLFNGCASAMESCPSIEACEQLNNLPESTKAFVKTQIAQCNLCHQCLPYGSTSETCQRALDQVMPNHCAGCTESQTAMCKVFYACSSIKMIHDSITLLGENYAEGAAGHETLDQMCMYCGNCSNYQAELQTTCSDWATISSGWDGQPPYVPDVLVLEGTENPNPTASPTPRPTNSRPTTGNGAIPSDLNPGGKGRRLRA